MKPIAFDPAAIRARLAYLGARQLDLANELGISLGSLSHYLNGYANPPPGFAERCTAALERLAAKRRVLAGGAA